MSRRFALADLPETIAVFPLAGAMMLPRARLPLNIFEPRYLAMLDDALKTEHRLIGMIQPLEKTGDAPPKLRRIGCAGRVTSFSETEDGRYLIALTGICRFRVGEEVEGFHPYRRVKAEWVDFARDLTARDSDPGFDRKAFLGLLKRYFEASGLSSDWSSLEEADEEMLVNSLSMLCPFAVEEKQALLEAPRLAERRETICALMEFAIASRGEDTGSLQ
ncbi:MAG: LON peptidase substrate-binding domain-containing protein [Rubrimonas sp.]|uniref:LON peptidase substrate-binding domain-containing protein n=1 Tax=Rubrimonas sp. TaxID=2036015 RepID=UPI002FDC8384